MSAYKDVIDHMVTALQGISGIGLVTTDLDAWNQKNPEDYPCLFVAPEKPEVERLAFLHPTSPDMLARMNVTIEGNVYSEYESDIAEKLETLMAESEKALVSNATLAGATTEVVLLSDESLWSVQDRYGLFSATYEVEYFYNHLAP